MITASLFSSVGIASAAGLVHGGGSAYANPYGQVYAGGHVSGAYNYGTTSGAAHAGAVRSPYAKGFTAGSTSCVNGVSCTHNGYGATSNGGSYAVTGTSTNNGNGTSTVTGTVKYVVPGTGTVQTKTGTRTVYHR